MTCLRPPLVALAARVGRTALTVLGRAAMGAELTRGAIRGAELIVGRDIGARDMGACDTAACDIPPPTWPPPIPPAEPPCPPPRCAHPGPAHASTKAQPATAATPNLSDVLMP